MSLSTSAARHKSLGDDLYKRSDKVNGELFALTYGALVVQLIKDYEDYDEVNKQLEKMGYNIGVRLIEDFLARTGLGRCKDFTEVGEVMAKVAFRSLLAITPSLIHHPVSPTQPKPAFSLIFDENPLTDFVELPEEAVEGGLVYAKVLEGVIRGALEMIQTSVTAQIVSDTLRGDERTELRVTLKVSKVPSAMIGQLLVSYRAMCILHGTDTAPQSKTLGDPLENFPIAEEGDDGSNFSSWSRRGDWSPSSLLLPPASLRPLIHQPLIPPMSSLRSPLVSPFQKESAYNRPNSPTGSLSSDDTIYEEDNSFNIPKLPDHSAVYILVKDNESATSETEYEKAGWRMLGATSSVPSTRSIQLVWMVTLLGIAALGGWAVGTMGNGLSGR